MDIIKLLKTYSHYLIHPFQTHEAFLHPERGDHYRPMKLSAYESLATSWIFIIINGISKLFILNLIISWLYSFFADTSLDYAGLINFSEVPGMYFLVLSAVLDIIFYPLFGFFIIQYWDIVIKLFGSLLKTPGDIAEKANQIISVYLSSRIFKIVPILGAPMQTLGAMVLMYAGLRKQLNASPILSVCIILSPIVILMGIASMVLLLVLLIA